MCVPTRSVGTRGAVTSSCKFSTVQLPLPRLLDAGLVSFRPRSEMEEDPSFKQLIPYCIFRYVEKQGGQWLFQYRRGKGQGEGRLHSKRSLGVGGHISLDDHLGEGGSPYEEGMRRELLEELDIRTEFLSVIYQPLVGHTSFESHNITEINNE